MKPEEKILHQSKPKLIIPSHSKVGISLDPGLVHNMLQISDFF